MSNTVLFTHLKIILLQYFSISVFNCIQTDRLYSSLRLCLFWVKITSGNAFPEMRLFGWSGKFYFPEIEIRWPKKKAFDHGNAFTLLFYLQRISGKWERERESAREEKIQSGIVISDRNHGAIVGLETFLELMIFFFSGLWLVFSDLCFPPSFPNTRKYFPENFLKCN